MTSAILLRVPVLAVVATFSATSTAASLGGQDSRPRPNVIVILADDLGYSDLGVQGLEDFSTPQLDALAASGVRCTSAYASHSFCSPMRAGLMAGRNQNRFGYVTNVPYDVLNPHLGLPVNEKTIARRLRKAGYRTGLVGKWHLGAHERYHPNNRGFQFFYGFLGGGHDYFKVDLRQGLQDGKLQPMQRNGRPEVFEGYLTDVLSREAVKFVEDSRDRPFFLFLSYNAPHVPMQAPESDLAHVAAIDDPGRRTYAAMVHAMDRGVGEVLAALDRLELRDDTLVFFLSDNGGRGSVNSARNGPLRGEKGRLLEGGIRIPLLISWPSTLPAGARYDEPISSIDVSRTALEVGKAEVARRLEGVNLIPFLRGEAEGTPHDTLCWRLEPGDEWAARSGDFKLLKDDEGPEPRLYDLSVDIGETADCRDRHPEVAASLQVKYEAWQSMNAPRVFPGPLEYRRRMRDIHRELLLQDATGVEGEAAGKEASSGGGEEDGGEVRSSDIDGKDGGVRR